MRKRRIGGVPVVESGTGKAVGNISLRDVQFLLTAPEIYHDYRFVASFFLNHRHLRLIHACYLKYLRILGIGHKTCKEIMIK
uniref:AMP-activated protein kinase gamma regulatory subunit n=1 Tax=Rhizophora mucronata TaxID=61149 RepID=A0A2P2KPR2_RHIMU